MAEQVNQRIEDMINELEQMQRTNLYSNEEIREISRRRKEFEYRIQRQTKQKEDFIHYIAYDMALLEDISIRRKEINLEEKKHDVELAIAKRLNRIFKQFIYRFQDDIEVYFQYIKFCKGVGFEHAISGIISQMLQVYGDKPKMWQMASKWESEELDNAENARNFLIKGLHRHPSAEILYLDLFNLELLLALNVEDNAKEKQVKRAGIVWKNGAKNVIGIKFLCKLCDISEKFSFAEAITSEIRGEIWSKHSSEKDIWSYVAGKELRGIHWEEVDDFITEGGTLPKKLNNFVCVYETAIQKFSEEALGTQYLHELLKLNEKTCSDRVKVSVIMRALAFLHDWRALAGDLYTLWIELERERGTMSTAELLEILEVACVNNPNSRCLWQDRILLNKDDEQKMESDLTKAEKHLKPEDMIVLWNSLIDNINSKAMIKRLYEKVRNCDSAVLLSVKPKLLHKFYELCGLKSARILYEEFLKTPPLQMDVHDIIIKLELSQDIPNIKYIRKCYEAAVHHFGTENFRIWLEYVEFETSSGNPKFVPSVYRRAVATLQPALVDKFIEMQSLGKVKVEK